MPSTNLPAMSDPAPAPPPSERADADGPAQAARGTASPGLRPTETAPRTYPASRSTRHRSESLPRDELRTMEIPDREALNRHAQNVEEATR